MTDPRAWMNRIAAEHQGDYVELFEKVYAAAAAGEGEVPWAEVADRHRVLREWAAERKLDGTGKKALVVGCGYGHDAEFVATLGYDTTAFDVSPTAIDVAKSKHPDSPVTYTVANLLEAPAEWSQAFDLVVEIATVQALPRSMRREVTDAIAGFVAPGGTLLVIAKKQQGPITEGPGPWPLTREELAAFGEAGLVEVRVQDLSAAQTSGEGRWLAELRR
ncbi:MULTISPECIES: class I SAM-dependent methyltransferase [Thermocrispum]|uniref:Class I SAM-dependent methyltransferase n=2 Tax=Thermocrispum agreste TaxID=37925 RepID=A0ABD6FBR0_9PSEU|nr:MULTISPECIES: class I SAM-dependent methyltransferase [Thermocrispum]